MKRILATLAIVIAAAGVTGCHHQVPPSHPLGTSSQANIPGTSGYRSP